MDFYFLFLETLNGFYFAFWIRIDTLRAKPNNQTPFSGITIDLSNPSAKKYKFFEKISKVLETLNFVWNGLLHS